MTQSQETYLVTHSVHYLLLSSLSVHRSNDVINIEQLLLTLEMRLCVCFTTLLCAYLSHFCIVM